VLLSFDILKSIHLNHFESIIANQVYPELINCLTEFCKNRKFTKTSLQSIEIIRQCVSQASELVIQILDQQPDTSESIDNLKVAESSTATSAVTGQPVYSLSIQTGFTKLSRKDDPFVKFWYPTLFALHQIIINGDLEVRTRYL
jgi:brefeldin A-inhibited guanine nucleotide-exchange protein